VEFSFEEAEYQNGSNVFHIINEFNHFEGNLSIFQPAIDITEQSLWKERASLLSFVSTL